MSAGDGRFHLRVQRYGWDLASETYDGGWVPLLTRFAAAAVDKLSLALGERVLDVATGPGTAAFLAADRVGPEGAVVATDIAEKMVRLAESRAATRDLRQMSFRRTDMESPVLDADSFDAALCVFGLMFAADMGAAVRELYRVLRPGGRLSVVVWGRRTHCGWADVFSIVDRHVTSDVCPMFFSLGVPGAMATALSRAGFSDVREEREPGVLEWPDADAAVESMLAGGAVALAYTKFAPDVRAKVRSEYAASIAPYREASGYRIPAEFVFGTARKPRTTRVPTPDPSPPRAE
jgi:ubiquinone/menaquinone biosynthesis C-methylase UbiE